MVVLVLVVVAGYDTVTGVCTGGVDACIYQLNLAFANTGV